jgi:hypothetical protein
MRVNFFRIKIMPEKYVKEAISSFKKDLGTNIPKGVALEGGSGIQYLFCSDKRKNEIIQLCKKYNFEEIDDYDIKEVEVDDEKFNEKYEATSTFYDNVGYKLKPVSLYGYNSD